MNKNTVQRLLALAELENLKSELDKENPDWDRTKEIIDNVHLLVLDIYYKSFDSDVPQGIIEKQTREELEKKYPTFF